MQRKFINTVKKSCKIDKPGNLCQCYDSMKSRQPTGSAEPEGGKKQQPHDKAERYAENNHGIGSRQVHFKRRNAHQGQHAYQKINQNAAAHYQNREPTAAITIRTGSPNNKDAIGKGVQCFAESQIRGSWQLKTEVFEFGFKANIPSKLPFVKGGNRYVKCVVLLSGFIISIRFCCLPAQDF